MKQFQVMRVKPFMCCESLGILPAAVRINLFHTESWYQMKRSLPRGAVRLSAWPRQTADRCRQRDTRPTEHWERRSRTSELLYLRPWRDPASVCLPADVQLQASYAGGGGGLGHSGRGGLVPRQNGGQWTHQAHTQTNTSQASGDPVSVSRWSPDLSWIKVLRQRVLRETAQRGAPQCGAPVTNTEEQQEVWSSASCRTFQKTNQISAQESREARNVQNNTKKRNHKFMLCWNPNRKTAFKLKPGVSPSFNSSANQSFGSKDCEIKSWIGSLSSPHDSCVCF